MRYENKIGSKGIVACAKHWVNYGAVMEKIIAEELLDFALSKEYTPGEMKAYRDGLARVAEIYKEFAIVLENQQKSE